MAALNLPLLKTAEGVEDPAEAELDLDTFAMVYDTYNNMIELIVYVIVIHLRMVMKQKLKKHVKNIKK